MVLLILLWSFQENAHSFNSVWLHTVVFKYCIFSFGTNYKVLATNTFIDKAIR